MTDSEVRGCLDAIERAWLEGRPREMAAYLHPQIVMALPGLAGRSGGAEAFIEGFVEFCESARVLTFQKSEPTVDVVGASAVATYTFLMKYERAGEQWRSTGRDLWVLARDNDRWLVTWRAMFDVHDDLLD
jgi:hypothetical protein